MKKFTALILILAIATGVAYTQPTLKQLPKCNSSLHESQVCYVNSMAKIRAAQFNYGEQYVNGWITQYKESSVTDYQKVLDRHFFPIIIAPDGTMFLADGHHRLRATAKLAKLQHHEYRIYLQVFKKFPHDTSVEANNQFWIWLESTKNAWLEDQGLARDKKYLPKSILNTTNDKYRTLAGWLMEEGWCYNSRQEDAVNYIEFYWADYFRNLVRNKKIKNYIDPNPTTLSGMQEKSAYLSYIQQTGICHADAAKALPAYCNTDNCSK